MKKLIGLLYGLLYDSPRLRVAISLYYDNT